MESKEQLIKTIKDWVRMDNEIRALQKEQLKKKAEKKEISGKLVQIMKTNSIDCFDINDGQILYNKKNVKKPITKKMLNSILSSYFQGDLDKATEVNNFIMENREETLKETIIRKLNK